VSKSQDLSLISSSDELQQTVEDENEQFLQAIIKYQELTVGSKYHTTFDFNEVHTWEQVLQVVNDASNQYNDISGPLGKIRKCFRRFGKTNQVFSAWSELLPSQSQYFSILCGGLKLIIGVRTSIGVIRIIITNFVKAAGRLHELRTEITDTLMELPVLLQNTRKAAGLFTKSEELQKCSVELYVVTLGTLQHIVQWYTEKAASIYPGFYSNSIIRI
jgi:hypothetical protein